ncbi:MAG TPA: hypothetical protein VGI95_19265 [Caulobacteraceae bacterium]|jgi:hypothetical protein
MKLTRLLLASAAVALSVGIGAASAGDITYTVGQQVGSDTVNGQIVTDGTIGILAQSNIVGWKLDLTGPGATTTLTSVGGTSSVLLQGNDLTATQTKLLFNYSGGDGGLLLFQKSLFSGAQYYCNNTTSFICASGASVAPASINNPSFQIAAASGTQVIGTAGPAIADADLAASIQALADARTAQMMLNGLFSQLMLGLNEQVSCGNCGGAGMGFGSFNVSAHGRYAINEEWTAMGGLDIGQYKQKGADVKLNAGFASALQYDPAGFGASRPYAEVGLSGSLQNTSYARQYLTTSGMGMGSGSARNYDVSAFALVGWVSRVTPRDEVAANIGVSRTWQIVGGYAEQTDIANPFNATVPGGTDIMDVANVGAQYTHLYGHRIEADVNVGLDWSFHSESGLKPVVANVQVTPSQPGFVYYEFGGRLGYRVSRRLTADAFVNAIVAPRAIGTSVHGGFGARWSF